MLVGFKKLCNQVEDQSELWGRQGFQGRPRIWGPMEATNHSRNHTRVLVKKIGFCDSIFGLVNSTYHFKITNHNQSPRKLLGFCRTKDKFGLIFLILNMIIQGSFSVGEKRRTFPMARPKCLMGDFTNLYGIYKAHQTNVWWTGLMNHESFSPTLAVHETVGHDQVAHKIGCLCILL